MKGFRTLAINGLVAAGLALLTYSAGVDWTQHVSPTVAMIIMAVVNFGLRLVTTTPVGEKH